MKKFLLSQIPPARLDASSLFRRSFHSQKASFLTIDAHNSLLSRKIDIFLGESNEAFILVPTEIGFAFKENADKKNELLPGADPGKISLLFDHQARHFSYGPTKYPRISIEQDLPRQNSSNISPATLWLWGATHAITLDGSEDEKFEESCRESSKRLRGVADILKDT